MCMASEEEIQASDKRRRRIKELRQEVLELMGKQKYRLAVNRYHFLLKLLQKEQLVTQMAELWWIMSRLYSALLDNENTIKYAKMAYEELKEFQKSGTEKDYLIELLEVYMKKWKELGLME